MSQSPAEFQQLDASSTYLRNFDALGAMIARGRSFSGRERNCCFLNTGDGRFADVSAATGFDFLDDGRSVAVTDWDGDGDLDIWIGNRTGPRLRFLSNELPNDNQFISFYLEGRQCNRDAIGARVELLLDGGAGRKLIRSLRAGDGFLSQSSKWVHFGFRSDETPQQVTVRWPGGQPQSYTRLQPNQRFRLVQGVAVAEPWQATRTVPVLNATPLSIPVATQRSRLVLTQRPPLPKLHLEDKSANSAVQNLTPPMLVTLWASWCAPCRQELQELVQAESTLRHQNLQLVALCTDGAEDDDPNGLAKAQQFLQEIGWPFAAASATTESLRDLTVLRHQAIYRERPLPLPSSFLVDAEGNVAVLYSGAVDRETLLADLQLLAAPVEQRLQAAFPFPGRFAAQLFARNIPLLAQAYSEAGYVDDAIAQLTEFLKQAQTDTSAAPPSSANPEQLAQLYQMLAGLYQSQSQVDSAIEAWRAAIALSSRRSDARIALAVALWERGRHAEAADELQATLDLGPDQPPLLNMVGQAWERLGETQRAIELYQKAATANDLAALANLGVVLQSTGRAAEAIGIYRRILQQEPRSVDAANNLAWILATHSSPDIRNGQQALRIAQRVNQWTGQRQPSVLDTLAAALAETGDYEQAIRVARSAEVIARRQEQLTLADKIRGRMERYRQSQPYREP